MKDADTKTQDLEKLLIDTAAPMGAFLREKIFEIHDIEWKGRDDPVTDLDKKVEQEIRKKVSAAMPANFLGEEYGLEDNGAEYTFIIDPIDGTKAFLRQDFNCAISIGIEKDGDTVAGIVYDFMRDVMYVAGSGRPYRLHAGKRVPDNTHRSGKVKLMIEKTDREAARFLGTIASTTTRDGSIALVLAQLASGCFDGMIIPPKKGAKVWDIAAGYHLLKQAGYELTDIYGDPTTIDKTTHGLVVTRPGIRTEAFENRMRSYRSESQYVVRSKEHYEHYLKYQKQLQEEKERVNA